MAQFIEADWLGILGLAAGLELADRRARRRPARALVRLAHDRLAERRLRVGHRDDGDRPIRRQKAPIVRLELLNNKSYASVIFIVFTVGAGLYCVSYLVPQFLSNIAGYNAAQSGDIMLVAGLPAFLMMPVLPRLLGRVDPRILVIVGPVAVRGELHARHLADRAKRRP